MDALTSFILFCFGVAIGSFLNVVALRYRGDHFSFDPKVIGGRSRCPHCGHTLGWYELVPLVSFAVQGGKCRECGARLGWHYPLVELLSGIIFVAVPARLLTWHAGTAYAVCWIAAFELLLLVTYIDIRLQIVPDELTALLGVAAVFAAIFSAGILGPANPSLLTPFSNAFGLQGDLWQNRLAAGFGAAAFFAVIIFATRGRGMGWGDAKLVLPLGFLFGWPDILFALAVAFVAGAVVGGYFLMRKKKSMKSALPFVPFIAFGAAFVFFLGAPALGAYFHIIGI